MSSTVDSRIVTMKFENSVFERAASTTLSTLSKLTAALSFSSSKTAIGDIQASAGRFNMGPMETAVSGVSGKFLALSTIAVTALSGITTKAIAAGTQLAKSFTTDPIKAGLSEYEQTLNATQTIMSGTGESVEQVSKTLKELNEYSDQTIYAFGDMTDNIKHFTNAGLSSEKAARVMKGIANATAAAGGSANEAARAMLGFGQSMSMGFVGLQDWNQVDNAGVATKEFKEELIKSGLAAGTLTKGMDGVVRTGKGTEVTFKNMRTTLAEQWLTSEALVTTLDRYSDTSTEVGKKAAENATRIKTLTQLMDVMKEGVQSGWSSSWFLIFGNLEEASKLWTGVGDAIGGMLEKSADARNKMLGDWNKLGGRTVLIEGISNAFNALKDVLGPIRDAFRDIFPPMTGKRLYELTVGFRNFTKGLRLGDETIENLRRTFRGVFAVISIIGQVIKGALGMFGRFFGAIGKGSGGFLEFTGSIGDFLVSLDEALKKGNGVTKFFEGLGDVISVPLKLIGVLAGLIKGLFGGSDISNASSAAGKLADAFTPLEALTERFSGAFNLWFKFFNKVKSVVAPIAETVVEALSGIGDALADAFSGGNFDKTLDAINTGLFAAIALMLKKFVSNGFNLNFTAIGGSGGLVDSITDSFGALSGTLQAMQANIQASTLLKIAGAVALLTVSVVALSLIDSKKLQKALAAMSVAFGQLLAAMAVLVKISGSAGFIKVPMIAAAMILLATAVLILTAAVKILSTMSWEELAKGLGGVAGLLIAISAAAVPLSANSSGMIRAGLAMIPLAIGIKILASATKDFASMNWSEIKKGLVGVAASLGIVAAAMWLMPSNMVLTAASLVGIGIALRIMANALAAFGRMSWDEMKAGFTGMAASLGIIAAAMWLMPPNMLLTAAALVVVGTALGTIGLAVKSMSGMSWDELKRGLTALAASLAILAAGLYLMSGALVGAAALIVTAGALAILTPVLVTLGKMSWGEIVKGLAALAGVFTVLGLAGLILGPVIPVILALGLAMVGVGAGMALAGAGALAFATAFTMVVAAGTAGVAVMTGMLAAIIHLIPETLRAFGDGIVAFADAIGRGGPAFVNAFTAVLNALLDGIIKTAPKVVKAMTALIKGALDILIDNAPSLAAAGLALLLAFLNAIHKNIYRIVSVAAGIIVEFLDALGDKMPRIVNAGFRMIIKFIRGVTDAIDENAEELGEAGGDLAWAIVEGMVKGLGSYIGVVKDKAIDLGKGLLGGIAEALDSNSPSKETYNLATYAGQGLVNGLGAYSKNVNKAANAVGRSALETLKMSLSGVSDAVPNEVDMSPVVSPVLDLSRLQREASRIGGMLDTPALSAGVSYSQAATISEERRAALVAAASTSTEPVVKEIKFEQTNNSPRALSDVEIYRNTRSLLSFAKEALNS